MMKSKTSIWDKAMFSIIAFFACILEYYYTRERITEEGESSYGEGQSPDREGQPQKQDEKVEKVSSLKQIRAALSDRYWWIIMIFYALYQAGIMFKGGFIFNIFCNEFFTEVNIFDLNLNAEMVQSVLALISGIPLAAGMLFIWPLAYRFGKRNMVIVGLIFSIIGSIICVTGPSDFMTMLIGQTFKGIGSIPGAYIYIMMALFADVLEHLEARFGFRCDGISMSVYNAILTVVNGLATAFFLFYYDNSAFSSAAVAEFFFVGYEIIAHAVLIVLLLFFGVEKILKRNKK